MDLFPEIKTQSKPKTYTVKKYSVSCVKEHDTGSIVLSNRNDVNTFVRQKIGNSGIETVLIIAVDTQNKIIGYNQIDGNHNQCALYPAAVFRFAIAACAAAIFLAHNHPGNSLKASEADWTLTHRIKTIGAALEIPLLDHLIVTESNFLSMREESRW